MLSFDGLKVDWKGWQHPSSNSELILVRLCWVYKGEEAPEDLVQGVVIEITDGKLGGVDLDTDRVYFEDRGMVAASDSINELDDGL